MIQINDLNDWTPLVIILIIIIVLILLVRAHDKYTVERDYQAWLRRNNFKDERKE